MTTRAEFIQYVEDHLREWYADRHYETGDGRQAVEDWDIQFPGLLNFVAAWTTTGGRTRDD